MYHVKCESDFVARFIPSPGVVRRWQLAEPFDFSVNGLQYRVPREFYTDGASVPRVAHPFVSPWELGIGFLPHDYGYFSGLMTRQYWDDVFNAFMVLDHVATWRRVAAYRVVRAFGGFTWARYRRENHKYALHFQAGRYKVRGWQRDTTNPPQEGGIA